MLTTPVLTAIEIEDCWGEIEDKVARGESIKNVILTLNGALIKMVSLDISQREAVLYAVKSAYWLHCAFAAKNRPCKNVTLFAFSKQNACSFVF